MVDFVEDKKASHRGLSFGEIVGQEELKEALLAVAANDSVNGLLIEGEKGTAKSTAVRALRELLPSQTVIEGCPYGCPPGDPADHCSVCRDRTEPRTAERSVPLVTLPLGATRERVVGTLSVADALDGDYEFDPGLLARANRGILYVDEVNLLDDHLVDVLLDAAASGINRVERDGVSVSHPAEFTLIGTMNPEEGSLRPQLRDRFALHATVTGCHDIDQRVEIIDRAIGRTESDAPREDQPRTDELRDQLHHARNRIDSVVLPPEFTETIAELCRDAGVDGHRADISTARAARTFAALDGRATVIQSDVRRATALTLPHRLQSQPFEDSPDATEIIDEQFEDDTDSERDSSTEERSEGHSDSTPQENRNENSRETDPDSDRSDEPNESDDSEVGHESMETRGPDEEGDDLSQTGTGSTADEDEPRDGTTVSAEEDSDESTERSPLIPGQSRADIGEGHAPEVSAPQIEAENRSTRTRAQPSADADGPQVRTQPADASRPIDAAASVRAATSRGSSSVESRDLRHSVRRGDASALVVFVVDASASMRPAMRAAKGTVLELLKDAYQQRDEVAFITFAGEEADVLLPPTDSVSLAARHLKDLPTGDRTPLPAGLCTAQQVLDRADPAASVIVLVTDGRANVAEQSPVKETRDAARQVADSGARMLVVDASDDKSGLIDTIVTETGGERVPLSSLSADRIDATVGDVHGNEQ